MPPLILSFFLGVLTLAPAVGSDQPAAAPSEPRDLRKLSLEELMNLDVNLGAVRRAHLKLSSHLLKLARIVGDEDGAGK